MTKREREQLQKAVRLPVIQRIIRNCTPEVLIDSRHAVWAGGGPEDGSLHGFKTLCGRLIDVDEWRELPEATVTCGSCLRIMAKIERTTMSNEKPSRRDVGYMGDHDFLRWQRRVITLYYETLGIEEGDLPAIDLRYRYDLGQKPEEVAAELVVKEKASLG